MTKEEELVEQVKAGKITEADAKLMEACGSAVCSKNTKLKSKIRVKRLGSARGERIVRKTKFAELPLSVWTAYIRPKNPIRYGSRKRLSRFNPQLAYSILSLYCPPKARIYDPFAGDGTRGQLAEWFGHRYVGVDLSAGIDSTGFIPDGKFDFCYTCPPYWNLEKYSKNPLDLFGIAEYPKFLERIKAVLKIVFRVLKTNTYCIWIVGNFRDKTGKMLHFNGDVVRLATEVGFTFWDEIIWFRYSVHNKRITKFIPNKKIIRVHEYVLVFRKI